MLFIFDTSIVLLSDCTFAEFCSEHTQASECLHFGCCVLYLDLFPAVNNYNYVTRCILLAFIFCFDFYYAFRLSQGHDVFEFAAMLWGRVVAQPGTTIR